MTKAAARRISQQIARIALEAKIMKPLLQERGLLLQLQQRLM